MPFSLSIIVPLFNKQDWIAACLQSVLAQDEPVAEIIVVDDGSQDHGPALVRALGERHACIRLLEQGNQGVSAVRNRGWRGASGSYLTFLDADDCLLPCFSARARALALACPKADVFGFGYQRRTADQEPRRVAGGLPADFLGYVPDYFASAARGPVVRSSANMVRSQALERIGGFPLGEPQGEDLFVWARLAESGAGAQAVAYDGGLVACVGEFEDNSRQARLNAVPYILRSYAQQSQDIAGRDSLRAYLWRLAVLHVLESYRCKRLPEARLRLEAIRPLFPWRARLLALLGAMMQAGLPLAPVLQVARTLRRRGGVLGRAEADSQDPGRARSSIFQGLGLKGFDYFDDKLNR